MRLLQQEGIPRFLATAAAAGITTLADRDGVDLSVILGGAETPLLELTDAFAGLAAGGERRPVRAILRIEDARGRILWQPPALPPVRMLSPESAWLVTDILADNEARTPAFGGNSPLLVNRPAAVKTGTTSDFRDNWTVGYTPDLVVGVWTGNPDNHPMKDISGVTGAAPIWHDLIEDALAGRPPRTFSRPPGLVRAEVCLPSGQRPTAACARRRMEWFKAGTEPREDDSYYRALLVCAATGLPAPAGGDCGTSPAVTRVFEFPPDEVLPWARSAGVALAPLPGYRDDIAIVPGAPASPGGGSGCPVRIVQPAPGLTLRLSRALPANVQVLSIEVSVAGAPPERLRVEVDGVPFAGLETPPYRVDWPLTVGAHRFRVVALRGTVEAETDEVGITVLPP